MREAVELKRILRRIDGRGYKAYKDIEGEYGFHEYILLVDHVQGDPFASPSRVRVKVLQGESRHGKERINPHGSAKPGDPGTNLNSCLR
jgi:predicted ABC-class ATPase